MNVADSAKLAKVLEAAGYHSITASQDHSADILLVNTCVVRQNAEDRASWFVTSMKNLKVQNPRLKIVLCGCLVSEPGRDVKKRFPHVDLFIGPNEPEKLKQYLNSPPLSPSLDKRGGGESSLLAGGEFVTIMHGCDNFCSYCVVPYVRGREVSRPMADVLAEVKGLIEQGVTDITLLGQNVNSYKPGLARLLREISSIQSSPANPKGVRISFLTSHPKDLTDEIIETVAELSCVAKDFMIPLQSGDNEILKQMNRGYTVEYFIDRVAKIRALMPLATISTDLLVGFPGETEEQFGNTIRAVKRLKFNDVHMFAYSSRPGTAAAVLPGQLPQAVIDGRLQRLITLVRQLAKEV